MKTMAQRICRVCLVAVLSTTFSVAANRYAVRSGNWNATSTWSATSGGASGASVPVAGDNVFIAEASFYTISIPSGYSAACASIQIGVANIYTNGYLTFGGPTSSLTVSGNVDLYQGSDFSAREIDVWDGTLTINGSFNMNVGASSTSSTRSTKVIVWSGTMTVGGNLVFNNVASGSALQNQIDLSGGAAKFNLAGSFTIANNIGTLTPGTSSTFNFNGTSAQTVPIGVSSVVYNNIDVNNTNPSGATLSAAVSATNVKGNIAVQSGKFSNGGFAIVGNAAKSFTVSNGATFTLTGTSGMVTGFGTKTFGATSTADYAGSDQTVSNESYGHLTLSGSGTKTMPGSSMTIAGNVTISGTASAAAGQALLVWGNFTIGSGCTFNAGSYTHTLKADFSNSGTFTSATSTIVFSGNANQNIIGSNTSVFNNLTILNSNGISLGANVTLNGTLTLTSGNITTNSWVVVLVSTGTVSRTSGHIVGNLRKFFAASAKTNTFEIGTGTAYTPVSVAFGTVTANGNLTATTSVGDHANIGSAAINPAKTVNRTWTLTNSGITFDNYSAAFTFVPSDVDAGANTNNFIVGKYSGSWTYPTVGSKTATTTQITGATSFSDFQIGETGGLPIQLSSFTAHPVIGAHSVTLEWTTLTETNNYGFEVQRKGPSESEFSTLSNSFIPGHGTTLQLQHYSYTDASVTSGNWSYRLKQIDLDGTDHFTDAVSVDVLTDVKEESLPTAFALKQNYPNPFNPSTVVSYQLPVASYVTLKVYNLLGQEVMTLVDEKQDAGMKSVKLNASGLASGVYLYRLQARPTEGGQAGQFSEIKTMIVLK